jgi:CheY-like chemotaxis protein
MEMLETGKHFDMIFMDLRMPVMNGFQATAYIREKLQMKVPIVILTASVLRNERERCISIGANDYMSKPFNPVHLDLCLQKYLQTEQQNIEKESESPFANSPFQSTHNNYSISNLLEIQVKESIRHILQLFITKIPQHIEDCKAAALKNNPEEFLEKTHKFKGSLSTIQVPTIYNLLVTAEGIIRDKKDPESTVSIFDEALAIYTNLVPEISKEVEQHITLTKF